jgi:preprotein translocase subunit SecF
LILIGVIFTFVNGVKLDIQFKGGTILKYDYSGEIDADKAADVAEATLGEEASAQLQSDFTGENTKLVISLASDEAISAEEQKKLSDAISAEFGAANPALSESLTVEPSWGGNSL